MDYNMIQNFSETLNNHVARYRALVAGIALENRGLTPDETLRLPFVMRSQEEISMDIQDSVHLLISSIKDLALMLGLPLERQPLLADLAARLPEPFQSRVRADVADLERLKNITHAENEINSHYIEEAMRLVCGNLNVLSGFTRYMGQSYPDYD